MNISMVGLTVKSLFIPNLLVALLRLLVELIKLIKELYPLFHLPRKSKKLKPIGYK